MENEQYLEMIFEMMDELKGSADTMWLSAGETVFERLWYIVETMDGRERLEKRFPEFA